MNAYFHAHVFLNVKMLRVLSSVTYDLFCQVFPKVMIFVKLMLNLSPLGLDRMHHILTVDNDLIG